DVQAERKRRVPAGADLEEPRPAHAHAGGPEVPDHEAQVLDLAVALLAEPAQPPAQPLQPVMDGLAAGGHPQELLDRPLPPPVHRRAPGNNKIAPAGL